MLGEHTSLGLRRSTGHPGGRERVYAVNSGFGDKYLLASVFFLNIFFFVGRWRRGVDVMDGQQMIKTELILVEAQSADLCVLFFLVTLFPFYFKCKGI